MGMPQRLPLQEELRKLERRLRRRWSGVFGGAPTGLKAYRASWLASFQGGYRRRSREQMWQDLAVGTPLLVSDFHPLRRSTRMLEFLLAELPIEQPPCLALELLPHRPPQPVRDLHQEELTMMDGRCLRDVYPDAIQELAEHNGWIAGVWKAGTPDERDQFAAACWRDWQKSHPNLNYLFQFGDWHLAENHLPTALRQHGARPKVLHQSPEPLWDRIRPHNEEPCLLLDNGHYAWLHTPPIAQWAAAVQGEDQRMSSGTLEAVADLLEELSAELADLLQTEAADECPYVFGPDDWRDFHHSLPKDFADAFHPDFPPSRFLSHPRENLFWLPEHPSWNLIVEMAAGLLLPASRKSLGFEIPGWLEHHAARSAFCHLIPLAWNPFLARHQAAQLRQAYGHTPDLACRVESRESYVAQRQLGMQAAASMLHFPLLDVSCAHDLLKSAPRAFIWYFALSTIQASAVSAS
jgi:hypothetical protein